MGVDRLPVIIGDHQGLALEQPAHQRVLVVRTDLAERRGGQIGQQGGDGVLGVLLVGPDDARRSAFDPARDVLMSPARDAALLVRDGAGTLVERQPGQLDTAIADRAHHQLRGQMLALPGVVGDRVSVLVGDEFVAAQHDPLDPLVAGDLNGRGVESEHDATVSGTVLAGRIFPQHFDIRDGDLAGGGGVLVGDRRQIGGVDDDIHAVEFAELTELEGGEGRLQGTATAGDDHLGDPAGVQRVQRVVGDIGQRQHVGIGHQNPGHIDGDVSVADHHRPAAGDIGFHMREVRVGVVPADEVDGGHTARKILAGDTQRAIGLRADGVDHRVIALGQLGCLDVLAHGDIAEEPEPLIRGRLLEDVADRLDLRMIGCHTGTHQSPWGGEHLEHVEAHIGAVAGDGFVGELQQGGRREIPGRACADDRDEIRAHALASSWSK